MYLFKIKHALIRLATGVVVIISSSYAMDHRIAIVNLSDAASAQEASQLQKHIADWQAFYNNADYPSLMASIAALESGCGIIHELHDIPGLDAPHDGTACIVDMRKIAGATEPHVHYKTTEIYYVLEGSGTIVIGEREYPVNRGDVITVPKGVGHYSVPSKNLILGVVSFPFFDIDDHVDLRAADETTRKSAKYDHVHYLHFVKN